ncbi:hypothetical protein ACWOFR_03795 [Carnobacterium gallinarum]|uniref:hypothetical protein n=1 Tax=Carnobacterium gallinarum TaxID=2749 RepID=UPI00055632D7|nr:hypothetical protein [Carnobacterium gallinarum]
MKNKKILFYSGLFSIVLLIGTSYFLDNFDKTETAIANEVPAPVSKEFIDTKKQMDQQLQAQKKQAEMTNTVVLPSVIPAPTVAENLEATTKDEITTKMLNSVDYFKSAKGNLTYYSESHEELRYSLDFAMTNDDYTLSYEKSIANSNVGVGVFDGTKLVRYDFVNGNLNKKDSYLTNDTNIDSSTYKGTTISDRITYGSDGIPMANYRFDSTYLGSAKQALLPENLTIGLLENFSNWDIISTENFLGLSVLKITGILPPHYAEKYSAENFTMKVDSKTGVLVQFQALKNEKIMENMEVHELLYNSELDSHVFTDTEEDILNELKN